MLFDSCRDREDVRVEDDVFGREADAFGEDLVCALADGDFTSGGIGLTLFIKRHDDHRRAVATHERSLPDERLLALFHRDRVDDALSLQALEPSLDHLPLGRVEHERHARDCGLRRREVQELLHRRVGVEHALVEVDVDDHRAGFNLLARDFECGVVVVGEDQFLELR